MRAPCPRDGLAPDTAVCSQLTPTTKNLSPSGSRVRASPPAARHLCTKETLGRKEAYGDSLPCVY